MDLRTFQAQWLLGEVPPERAHEVATDLLVAGDSTLALVELAGMFGETRGTVGPVVERVFAEAGLGPLPREAALWRAAYHAAGQIAGGDVAPRDGAAKLWHLCNELDMAEPLRYFVYLAADYGEGPGDFAAESAWFDARIRESAQELLAAVPPDGQSPPRGPA